MLPQLASRSSRRLPLTLRLRTIPSVLRVRCEHLPHQGREGHIQRGVQVVGKRAGVVLQDLNHRRGIVRDDDLGLQHAQQARLPLRQTEGARSIDGRIHIVAAPNSPDGRQAQTDLGRHE